MGNKESKEINREPRVEVLTSVSVAALVTYRKDTDGEVLLLVRKKNGKWGLPAGGIRIHNEEDRPETPLEALSRELREETSLDLPFIDKKPKLLAVLNHPHPTMQRNSLGIIYKLSFGNDEPELAEIEDSGEIEQVQFFNLKELRDLLEDDGNIYRPDFNVGIIRWWVRNEWVGDYFQNYDYPHHGEELDETTIKRLREEEA